MKTVLAMIVAMAATATAAQANTSVSHGAIRSNASAVQRTCERADSEGFCGLTLVHASRISTVAPVTSNDQGRAQLNRLIASLN